MPFVLGIFMIMNNYFNSDIDIYSFENICRKFYLRKKSLKIMKNIINVKLNKQKIFKDFIIYCGFFYVVILVSLLVLWVWKKS
jgi:hypothetical protein